VGAAGAEQARRELTGRRAGKQEVEVFVAHLHDVGAGDNPLGGRGGPLAVGCHRRPDVGVVARDQPAAVRGFDQPDHLLAARREQHAEGPGVDGGAALGDRRVTHVPAELELVGGGTAGIEPRERPAGGPARGTGQDQLDPVPLQVRADQGAVVVGSDLRDEHGALPEPGERDGDVGLGSRQGGRPARHGRPGRPRPRAIHRQR
jgi:hypothetical protein